MFRRLAMVVAALCVTSAPEPSLAECKLDRLAELPTTMSASKPIVTVKINGSDARFVADSGAFFSMITAKDAKRYGLQPTSAPFGFYVQGVSGDATVDFAMAQDFTLAGILLHRVSFLVGGSEAGGEAIGVLGQNVFRAGDVEYDLANGVIRLFRPEGCGKAMLGYWLRPGEVYSELPISRTTPIEPHTRGEVFIDGVRLRAIFDTGASASVLSLSAAKRIGVGPQSAGAVPSEVMGGVGREIEQTWVVPVRSFKIGDEEIKGTRLRVARMGSLDADMLIGVDFFLSHHVYVATSQNKLYFTYNGGPVFNLTAPASVVDAASVAPSAKPAAAATTAMAAPPDPGAAASADRRGAADLARHDVAGAIRELDRAIALAPDQPDYLYDRAQARAAGKDVAGSRADIDRVLALDPRRPSALLFRALFELKSGAKTAAAADLDAADKAARPEDDLRLVLGQAYAEADRFPDAIRQYDLWIVASKDDFRMSHARNGRCWVRALQGRDLDLALADCNAALRLSPGAPDILDSRGLVLFRRAEFDKAIGDYDRALRSNPKLAWSLYGRGLAERRLGRTADADKDIAAAEAISPEIVAKAKGYGLTF